MKKLLVFCLLAGLLFAGCKPSEQIPQDTEATAAASEPGAAETGAAKEILPLPDTTFENLDDSIAAISFEQGDIYQDEAGYTLFKMLIYSYDKFDLADVSRLAEGDSIVVSGESIKIDSLQQNEHGTYLINGGLDDGGLDLATDDSGIYYVQDYSDMKRWHLVGEAIYTISDTFTFTDSSDLEKGTVTYSADDLLNNHPDIIFSFQPHNTVVRIENGIVVTMERVYTP